jgi:hypothetical protein
MKTFEEILNKVKDTSVKELIQSKVLELNGLSKEISNIYDKSTSFPSAKNESWSKAENSIELIEDIQNLLSPYINIEYLDLYYLLK